MSQTTSKIQKRDLTKGPIFGHVIRIALPMVIGIGSIISFSLADSYFIGQLGATELAAIGVYVPCHHDFFQFDIWDGYCNERGCVAQNRCRTC